MGAAEPCSAEEPAQMDDSENRADAERQPRVYQEVRLIPLCRLTLPPVYLCQDKPSGPEMERMECSIQREGVCEPILVRPDPVMNGMYQIISGVWRAEASRRCGFEVIPAVIQECDDTHAVVRRTESNLVRRCLGLKEICRQLEILANELRHQGMRTDLMPGGEKPLTMEQVSRQMGISYEKLRRCLRLNDLPEEFLDMVDAGLLKRCAADQLTALSKESRQVLLEYVQEHRRYPSQAECKSLYRAEQENEGRLTYELIGRVLDPKRKKGADRNEKAGGSQQPPAGAQNQITLDAAVVGLILGRTQKDPEQLRSDIYKVLLWAKQNGLPEQLTDAPAEPEALYGAGGWDLPPEQAHAG